MQSFDLRQLAYERLQDLGDGEKWILYKDARTLLCRGFSIKKQEGRTLLLAMSKAGLIYIDRRGRIRFSNGKEGVEEK